MSKRRRGERGRERGRGEEMRNAQERREMR